MQVYHCDCDNIYVVILSSNLSGSYNSALLVKHLYHEQYGDKKIYVVDSESASCGEAQIALKLRDLEEEGISFEEITTKIDQFRDEMKTYFVLDNLETLRKNGRLSGVKALVASTLSIKPLMGSNKGEIIQRGQSIGMKKSLGKLADLLAEEIKNANLKRLVISHCNAPERAELVKKLILSKVPFTETIILNTAGISSMYANDGGIIVSV